MKNKKKINFLHGTIMTLIAISSLYAIDYFVGIIYEDIAPEFGRKNLNLALDDYTDDDKKRRLLRHRPHPYLTYENTPDYYHNGIRQHNNKGYRDSNDTAQLPTPTTIRILALGGSTTYGQGVNSPDDAWPTRLENLLNESLSSKSSIYRVEIINGGIPWGSSAELLNHYIFRDRYLNPDLVILHTGGNDRRPLVQNNYNPEYTHWRSIKSGTGNKLRPGEKRIIESSNIIKFLYSIWYTRMGYATSSAYIHTNSSAKIRKEDAVKNVNSNEPVGFSRNLSLLIRNIKNDGAIPVYFQFYMTGKEMFSKEAESALLRADTATNFTELLDVNKIAMRKNEGVARLITSNHNVKFFKMEENSIPVSYFVDQSHLNVEGQQLKAQFMFERILPYTLEIISNRIRQNH